MANSLLSVASTLANLIWLWAGSALSYVAALAYSGAKVLQCPHHGA